LRQDPGKIFFQWLRPTIVLSNRKPVLGYARDELLTIKISWKLDRAYSQGKRVGASGILRCLASARQGSQGEKP
jgi:hypothetical protein